MKLAYAVKDLKSTASEHGAGKIIKSIVQVCEKYVENPRETPTTIKWEGSPRG